MTGIALMGAGRMAKVHAAAIAAAGAHVATVYDPVEDAAGALAAATGARVAASAGAAMADPAVDAVMIATSSDTHVALLFEAVAAGKPVLCEKPLTTDVESAYAIVTKEAALGKQLIQVGFMRRFDSEYAALRELISSGGLGNPLMVHCTHRNPAVPPHFNSEFMIRDSVVHEVDVARFLLDEEIASVQVIKGVATSTAPEGTNDPMLVVFEMASGRIVTDEIYVRTGVAYEVRTEVVGESGSALIGLDQNLLVKSTDGRWGGQITPGFVERFGQAYAVELQRWVDAASQGTIDGPGAWDGYAAVAVCEAGVQALTAAGKVQVQLQNRPEVAR